MKKFNKKNLIPYICFAIILIVAFYFRFYHLHERLSFDGDSTRDALVAREGAAIMQLPLTGPFSSIGQFTFGPWYYYFLILFSKIVQSPYAPWLFMNISSIFFIIVLFILGSATENIWLGVLAAALAALSPPQITLGSVVSNPNLTPLFSAIALLSFIYIIQKRNSYIWGCILGLAIGIGINIHYQMNGMIILPVLLFIFRYYSAIIPSLLGLALTFLPLLFFDLTNHWYTIRGMYIYLLLGRNNIYVPNSWTIYVKDFWPHFLTNTFGFPALIFIIICLITGCFAIGNLWKTKKELIKKHTPLFLIILAFLYNFILLRYYWGTRSLNYVQYLHPFLFLFCGYALYIIVKRFKWKSLAYGILFFSFMYIAYHNRTLMRVNENTIKIHEDVKYLIQSYPNESFSLYTCHSETANKAQALALVLYDYRKIKTDGKKLAFASNTCPKPNLPITSLTSNVPTLLYPYIKKADMYDFSLASESAILQEGWKRIDSSMKYNEVARWWFDEKP
jgi:hypothetical protein